MAIVSGQKQRVWWWSAWILLVLGQAGLVRAEEPQAPAEEQTAEGEVPSDPGAEGAPTSLDATPSTSDQDAAAESVPSSEDEGASPEYLALVAQALSEYAARHFEEARALFLKAHEMFPNARTLRGLGMTEFERRQYLPCITYLEGALTETVKPLTGELRADTERLLSRAKTFVGAVQIDVTPASARVSIDGEPVDLAAKPFVLQVGEHTLEAHAAQHIAQRQTLSVRGGETMRIALRLERAQNTSAELNHDKKWWKSPWLWIGVGAVVAAAAVGVVASNREDPQPKVRQAPPETTDHTVGTFQALGSRRQ